MLERATDAFGEADTPKPDDPVPLHARIGQLALENFLESVLTTAGLLSAKP